SWTEGEGQKRKYHQAMTLWDMASGQVQQSHPMENTSAIALSPDGKVLAQSSYKVKDNRIDTIEVRRQDLTTGKDLPPLASPPSKNFVSFLTYSPDGSTLAGVD